MARVSIKGVLVGGLVDVVLSSILGIPFVSFVIVTRGLAHLPKDQMQRALTAAIHTTPSLYAVQLLIGAACTVLGGYIAARLAKHDYVLNGVLSSLVCVAIGIYSIAARKSPDPLIVQFTLLFIVTPLCGTAGGYLARPHRTPNAA